MRRIVDALGVAGLVVLLAGCWPLPGQNADRTSHNAGEERINVETVGDLDEVWQYTMPYSDGPLSAPVVSPGRVHLTVPCGVATVNARTGSEEWLDIIAPSSDQCETFSYSDNVTGDPHVVRHPDGDRLVAGAASWAVVHPPREESGWWSASFDVATGERDPDPYAGLVGAARGDSFVGTSRVGISGFPSGTRTYVHLRGDTNRTFHLYDGGLGDSRMPGLTLGSEHLFQTGSGPGGTGVRAFSRSGDGPDCGDSERDECPVWVTPTVGLWPTRPVIGSGGSVLYSRTTEMLYALDAATGDVLWTAEGVGRGDEPALAEGLLYVPGNDGRVLVFDAAGCGAGTCEPLWEIDTGTGAETETPAVAGGVVYVTSDGSVQASDAAGCDASTCTETLWSAPSDTPVVVAHGRLYTTVDNTLISYGVD